MEAAGALLVLLILGIFIVFPIYVLVRLADHAGQIQVLRRELAALRRAAREEAPTPVPPAPKPEPPQVAPQAPRPPTPPERVTPRTQPAAPAPAPPPVAPRPEPARPAPTPTPAAPTPAPAVTRPAAVPSARPEAPTPPPAAPPAPPAARPPSPARPMAGPLRGFDFEAVVGANWLAKLGVAAIAVAAAFFLKYAIDVGWLDARARVVLGVAAAGVMYGVGQWLLTKPRYRTYAQALASGGVVVFFLSIYAAYNYYHLIEFSTAFAVLAVAALAASLLALSNDTQAVAVLCILGGFATPILIRSGTTGPGDLNHLYTYLVGLNLWTILLVRIRPWHSLLVLSLGATWVLFFGAGHLDRHNYWAVEGFGALFLLFSVTGGRWFARVDGRGGPASPEAGVAMVLAGFAAFSIASLYALTGVAWFGLPALVAVGVVVAIGLVVAPYALGGLGEAGPAIAALLRALGSVALLVLVAITIATASAVTREQAPAAFIFTVITYLIFLGIALHMQREQGGGQPAIGLVFANTLTHAVGAVHALAPLQILALPAALFWLPLAGWIGLAALPVVRRRDDSLPGLSAALIVVSLLLPLVTLAWLWTRVPLRTPVLPPLEAFGAEFVLLSATWAMLRHAARDADLRVDVIGQLATVAVYFTLFVGLAWNHTLGGLSLLCGCALALALYYSLLGSLVLLREEDELGRLTYLGLALTFATIALPLQLRAAALTVAWAAESAALIWVGLAGQERRLRWYGVVLLATTTGKTLGFDLPEVSAAGFLLNPGFLSGVAVAVAAYASAVLLWQRREEVSAGERVLPVVAVLVGSTLVVTFLSTELWFHTGATWSAAGRESAQQCILTLLWSAAAIVAITAGTRVRSVPVQALGGVLLALALAKAAFVDLMMSPVPFRVLANTRFGAGAAVLAALYVAAWPWRPRGEGAARGLGGLRSWFLWLASAVTVLFVSFDLWQRGAGRLDTQHLSLSIFWSSYALALVLAGLTVRERCLCWCGLALLAVGAGETLALDLPQVTATGFLLNPRFLSGLAVAAAAYPSAALLWQRRETLPEGERVLPVSAVTAASALTVAFLSAELWSAMGAHWPAGGRASAQQFVLTALWSVAAVIALVAGSRFRSVPVQVLGGLLLTLALGKATFVDLAFSPSPFHMLMNTRFGAGAAVIAALYLGAWALYRCDRAAREELSDLRAAMFTAASIVTLVFVSLDLWDRAAGHPSVQQLSLSIFWSCYALVVFSVGIALRLRPVRLAAMGLLYVAVFKVFLFDLNFLETPYRIISFLGLGLILLLVSLLYHRFEERLK